MLLLVLTDFGSAPLSGSSKSSAAPQGGASQEPRATLARASDPCQRATVPHGIPTQQAKPATGSTNSGSDPGSVPTAWPRQGADAQSWAETGPVGRRSVGGGPRGGRSRQLWPISASRALTVLFLVKVN